MKAVVGGFNQGNNLGGALSVIVKTDCETDGLSATLLSTRDTPQTLLDYCLLHTDNEMTEKQATVSYSCIINNI